MYDSFINENQFNGINQGEQSVLQYELNQQGLQVQGQQNPINRSP